MKINFKKVEDYLVELNDVDRKILASYSALCDCLAAYLGNAFEIVVHSLGVGDEFTQKVVNKKSDRSSLREDSSFVMTLEQVNAKIQNDDPPVVVYYGTKYGEEMYKSASIGIVGTDNKLIGMLCINFQLNAPFMDILKSLVIPSNFVASHLFMNNQNQNGSVGYEATLYETIQHTRDVVMSDPQIPPKFKRKEIIRRLYEAGVFEIKNGVAICAELLGVTIATIYMHLRNFEEKNSNSQIIQN